ncbi:MAG: tetratricopeptide repeat protein [Desulfobacterales bacterium]|nr:tetratricopeptide repeat protein [Desulfobacterales bacterium]
MYGSTPDSHNRRPKSNPSAIARLFHQAFRCHGNGDLDGALDLYHRVLALDPDNFEARYNLGIIHHSQGELEQARQHYRSVLRLVPDHLPTRYSLGNVCRDIGDRDGAIEAYQRVIALDPGHADALHNLGVIFFLGNQPGAAIDCYRRALAVEPGFGPGHYNLGVALYHAGRLEEAAASYRAAIRINPDDGDSHFNLGITLRELDRLEEAAASYRAALANNPDDVHAHYNLGSIMKELGELDQAVSCFNRALELDPGYGTALCNLAGVYHIMGSIDKAISCYQRSLDLGNDTPATHHILAALTGHTTESAPRQYVVDLFDGYAPRFDQSLQGELGYLVPERMARALAQLVDVPPRFSRALDLGCGPGLSGAPFRGRVDSLVGVDLSEKMLARAKAKNIYDQLHCEELVSFLEKREERYDLFLAADLLVYLGKVDPLFAALRKRCRPWARFVFSIETCTQSDYVLRQSGRYAQSAAYIERLCDRHGFIIEYRRDTGIRKERGAWIPGQIFVLCRPEDCSRSPGAA